MSRPHLCQPQPGRSCGACCGLYNFKERSPRALEERLQHRTNAVRALGQERAALQAWAHEEQLHALSSLLVPALPTCHFVGFIAKGQVGCLLHPMVIGADLRDLGVYQSSAICEAFTCPSFTWLNDAELAAILRSTLGWYDYGLAVTDVELLRAICKQATQRRGASFSTTRLQEEPASQALATFFSWKVTWPYRDMQRRFGAFDVEAHHDLEVPRASIDYTALGAAPSSFDAIFLCLESCFENRAQLRQAEALVSQALDELVAALG